MPDFDNKDFQGEWRISDKSNNEIGIINFDAKTLRAPGSSSQERLTKYQYNLFKALLENKGRLLSSEELYDAYKGQPNAHSQDEFVDYKKNLTDAVYNLKKKYPMLKDCIENGKGYGTYFFNGELCKKQYDTAPTVSGGDNISGNPGESGSGVSPSAKGAVITGNEGEKITPPEAGDVTGDNKVGAKKKKSVGPWKAVALAAIAFSVLLMGLAAAALLGNGRGADKTESEIMRNRDNTVREMLTGAYDSIEIEDGLTAYAREDALVSLLAEKGYGNSNYIRSYYYDGDMLVFAEYAGEDLHQFCFENGELIRWKYSEDVSNAGNTVNHDNENSEAFNQWEKWVLDDSAELVKLWGFAELTGSSIKDFIFPDSNSRYISEAELRGLSREEVRTALNELYARHGRRFYAPSWQAYFESKSWYTPKVELDDFSESIFNDYELENKRTLQKWEMEHGWR